MRNTSDENEFLEQFRNKQSNLKFSSYLFIATKKVSDEREDIQKMYDKNEVIAACCVNSFRSIKKSSADAVLDSI